MRDPIYFYGALFEGRQALYERRSRLSEAEQKRFPRLFVLGLVFAASTLRLGAPDFAATAAYKSSADWWHGRWRSQTNGRPVESMLGWTTGGPDNVPGIVLDWYKWSGANM